MHILSVSIIIDKNSTIFTLGGVVLNFNSYRELASHGSSDFPVAYYFFAKSPNTDYFPYHWHPEWEIIHVISGKLDLIINGITMSFEANSYHILNPFDLHSGSWSDCEYESIVFDLNAMSPNIYFSDNFNKLHVCCNIGSNTLCYNICSNLFNTINSQNINKFTFIGNLFLLFGTIEDNNYYENSLEDNLRFYKLSESIMPSLSFMKEHYKENISLDTLAKISGFNKKYFCKIFKTFTLKTPMEYLNSLRISIAKKMLLQDNSCSITDVAYSCGFNDVSYFIRVFKKECGITPNKYRKD